MASDLLCHYTYDCGPTSAYSLVISIHSGQYQMHMSPSNDKQTERGNIAIYSKTSLSGTLTKWDTSLSGTLLAGPEFSSIIL